MADLHIDLPKGTLDLLVLKTLALESQHGWAMANWILRVSSEALHIQQAKLAPTLRRLERGGLIYRREVRAARYDSARYYALTDAGQKRLEEMTVIPADSLSNTCPRSAT